MMILLIKCPYLLLQCSHFLVTFFSLPFFIIIESDPVNVRKRSSNLESLPVQGQLIRKMQEAILDGRVDRQKRSMRLHYLRHVSRRNKRNLAMRGRSKRSITQDASMWVANITIRVVRNITF